MKHFLTTVFFLGTLGLAAVHGQTGWNWDCRSCPATPTRFETENQHYYDTGSQVPVYNLDPSICFEPGWDIGGFFSAMFTEQPGVSDGIGGGFLLDYFFDRNIGIEMNYAVHGQGSAMHVFHTNVVYRLPINGCFCGAWAPYAFGGAGFQADGQFDLLLDIGVGVEVRFQSWGCTALFADYSYNFVEKNFDFSQVRAGVKLPF